MFRKETVLATDPILLDPTVTVVVRPLLRNPTLDMLQVQVAAPTAPAQLHHHPAETPI